VGLWGLAGSVLSCGRCLSWRGGLSPLLSWETEETASTSGQPGPHQHLWIPSAPTLLWLWMSAAPREAAEKEAQALAKLPGAQLCSLEIVLWFQKAYLCPSILYGGI